MRPLDILFYLLLLLYTTVSAKPFEQDKLRARDASEGGPTPRKVFLLLTTKWLHLDGDKSESLADYNLQNPRESIYHAALEIQGDGVKSGSWRADIDLNGGRFSTDDEDFMRAFVRVRDYGLGNPTDAPVNHFTGNNRYQRVIEMGTTNLANNALLDETGNGVVQRVWSNNPTYSGSSHNCISVVKELAAELGVKPPPEVATIFKESLDSDLMARRHSSWEEKDVAVRLEKYPPGGATAQREYWYFDVTEKNKPQLLARTTGSEIPVIPGEPKGFGINGQGVRQLIKNVQEYLNFFGRNPPTENFLDQGLVDISTDEKVAVRSPWDLGDSIYDSVGDSTSAGSKRALSVSSETTEIAWVRTGGYVKSVVSAGSTSLQVLGVVGSAVAALYIIVDIVNGDYKAAAFGAAGIAAGGLGIALDLLVAGPIGTVVGLVAGILLAM